MFIPSNLKVRIMLQIVVSIVILVIVLGGLLAISITRTDGKELKKSCGCALPGNEGKSSSGCVSSCEK